ncbi:hypothetical protein Hypma_003126 [Hypsizygus marmoreus]|uniref:Uncharacterized protein n=1 Tax=Hypsizygus marmoreus TaxID=39966 RepID=A0A369JBG9_HYPMA|nr:hypothetical protein Hypma_003126 [Hypsizygus marmoreus]
MYHREASNVSPTLIRFYLRPVSLAGWVIMGRAGFELGSKDRVDFPRPSFSTTVDNLRAQHCYRRSRGSARTMISWNHQ